MEKGELIADSQEIYQNEDFLGKVEITFTDYFYQERVDELRNRLLFIIYSDICSINCDCFPDKQKKLSVL